MTERHTPAALAALLLVGCAAPSEAELSAGNPTSGERVYLSEDCADCHSEDGSGGSGGSLASVHAMSNQEVWGIIYYGVPEMPAYPHLSTQEIADMIAWMRETVD